MEIVVLKCPSCTADVRLTGNKEFGFCQYCGTKITQNVQNSNICAQNTKNEPIIKARVTIVMTGYGDLTLTSTSLIWNKSATSFLTFGALNALTDNHFMIPLNTIAKIGTYTYFPGGGLVITLNTGKEYKIAFKHKKDFKVVYDYLINKIH